MRYCLTSSALRRAGFFKRKEDKFMTFQELSQQNDFLAMWGLNWLLITILLGMSYLTIVVYYRHRFSRSEQVHPLQIISFMTGLTVLFLAQGSPLNFLAHGYLFSAHMIQMAIMYMLVPPLLILGTPTWIFKMILEYPLPKKILSVLTKPLIAIILFNGLFSVYHFPIIFDTVMGQHMLHNVYHGILFFSACCMWWPILSPVAELDRLTELRKIGYILTGSVLITPVCALVIFSPSVLYETYVNSPQLFSILPLIDDQQLGGVMMKVIQEGAYFTALCVVFFQWVNREKSSTTIDPVKPLMQRPSTQGQNRV